MGNKTCPQCREFCSISFKLYLSATENVKKRDAIQADLDLAESEVKRRKSEMAKKSMTEFLFLVEEKVKTSWSWKTYESTTKDGRSLLHWAADYGNLDIYQSVMDKVPDKNPKDKTGITPLHCAADVGHPDICQLILNNVTDKCPKDKNGHTPLHCSARKGHTLIHKMIMETCEDKNPEQIKGTFAGYTPLHAAAENGHVEVCRLIMDAVKDISPKTKKDKTTPFQLATNNGHRAVQDLILTYAANSAAAALAEFRST
jgi:ankyrin repeat protein